MLQIILKTIVVTTFSPLLLASDVNDVTSDDSGRTDVLEKQSPLSVKGNDRHFYRPPVLDPKSLSVRSVDTVSPTVVSEPTNQSIQQQPANSIIENRPMRSEASIEQQKGVNIGDDSSNGARITNTTVSGSQSTDSSHTESHPSSPHGASNSEPSIKPKWHITPQWVERHLKSSFSRHLDQSESDHVLSFYHFGEHGEFSVIGMERVRGENYHQQLTILIFEQERLVGSYPHVHSFPVNIDVSGHVIFPPQFKSSHQIDLSERLFPTLCQGDIRPCIPWEDEPEGQILAEDL